MKVAVIGSGVSGLAATWLLNEHSDHEVHLYEADDRPGGHANTVRFRPPNDPTSAGVDVDTGFIVFNPPTYPNFLRFLKLFPPPEDQLPKPLSWLSSLFTSSPPEPTKVPDDGIRILPTEMTFSVSRDSGAFEWAGKNPFTVFCQPSRLFDSSMWRMLYDVFRFNACSLRFIQRPGERQRSIGQYLREEGYSNAFKDNYLIPMTAAIWSTPPDRCFDDFPAQTLIQFMYNHSLLQITGKPKWLTICGGSHRYVNQILGRLPKSQLHLSSRINCVSSISKQGAGRRKLEIVTDNDEKYVYDHVIFACHSDEALRILQASDDIRNEEERILGSFEWNKNEVVLHSDPELMPKSRMAWSCWNYLTYSDGHDKANIDRVSFLMVFIDGMNSLQHIPEDKYGPVLATLNPPPEIQIDECKVQGRWKYEHPVLGDKAVKAQQQMYGIQNKRSISYAGAYLKYGFHEDGFTSGLLAACSIEDEDLYERINQQFTSSTRDGNKTNNKVIQTKNVTVRPPFEIEHADHHLFFGQSVMSRIVATLFGVFEASGLRAFIGTLSSVVLRTLEIFIVWPVSVLFGMNRTLVVRRKAL
ncbi:hypothetical protein AN958_11354 [Leucoagaricus sp. SymC.cos]|nr:hypothetical protein AN958_11354 [Leucoagaricus sp. SymC.cos]